MSLPAAYLEEINALSREVSKSQPADILQFCANFFSHRLESERAKLFSQSSTLMTNPFAESSGSFPGTFGGAFDGAHDAIREDDEEEVHSPTALNFKPQYHMGAHSSRSPGRRGASSRRTHSPSSGGGSGSGGGGGGAGGGGSGGGGGGSSSSGSSGSRRGRPAGPGNSYLSNSPGAPSYLSPNMMQPDFPSNYNRNRRTSVSAESLVPTATNDEWSPPVHPKTDEQTARLKAAVSKNFLFTALDEDQFSQVLLALVEKPIPSKDMRVITQGDVGDYFYVVEKGEFDVFVNPIGRMMPGPDGMGKKVTAIGPGGSFGELALMYNAPRAATVTSTSPYNILWALDRVTFRRILMENTFKRRRMYEAFLEEVPLLVSLVASERSKIADALDTHVYEAGETIIQEGDPGDRFYFIESGVAEVHKSTVPGGSVGTLNKGDYFGELALLNDAPRAASIVAKSKVKVAFLGKGGFQRLLGPVADIMRRNDPRLGESVDPLAGAAGASGLDGSVDPMQESAGRGWPVQV